MVHEPGPVLLKTSGRSKAGPSTRRIYDECDLTRVAINGRRCRVRLRMAANAQLTRRNNFALLKDEALCFLKTLRLLRHPPNSRTLCI